MSEISDSANHHAPPSTARTPLLTPKQVAAQLGVPVPWVREHATRRNPRLPVVRLGGSWHRGTKSLLRFRQEDIDWFLHSYKKEPFIAPQLVPMPSLPAPPPPKRRKYCHQRGSLQLTKSGSWKADWYEYVEDPESGRERRVHRSIVVGYKNVISQSEAKQELDDIVREVNEENNWRR